MCNTVPNASNSHAVVFAFAVLRFELELKRGRVSRLVVLGGVVRLVFGDLFKFEFSLVNCLQE